MNNKGIQFRRRQASFLLFYRQILSFSILASVWIFIGDSILGLIKPDTSSLFMTVLYFIEWFSLRLPTFSFIGALGLTHTVQKKQYYYYRNQGYSIKSLIFMSWIANGSIGLLLIISSNIAGRYA